MDLSALRETLRYEAARCCGWSAYRLRASRSICTGCLSTRAARTLQLDPLKADLLLGNIDKRAGKLPTPADRAGDDTGDAAASGRSNALVGEGAATSVACAGADAGSRTCIHERSAAAAASQDSSRPSTASISRRARVLASHWGSAVTGRVEADQTGAGKCCVDAAVAFRVREVGATGQTFSAPAILLCFVALSERALPAPRLPARLSLSKSRHGAKSTNQTHEAVRLITMPRFKKVFLTKASPNTFLWLSIVLSTILRKMKPKISVWENLW